MSVSDNLAALGLELPTTPAPVGSYVPALRSGDLVYTSGQLPLVNGILPSTGTLSGPDDVARGADLARAAALNALAAAAHAAGGLDRIVRIVKVTVYVASDPTFTAQAAVANGASDLLVAIFGEPGRHARAAIGVAALPLGTPVEVELVCQVA